MKKQLVLLFALVSVNAFAQDFYDLNTIQEIRLTFANPNWHQMLINEALGGEGYIPAESVSINGEVFQNVGVKYKGNSSFNTSNAKNPFHIELDTYQNQDYHGFKDIKLSNVYYDPSFIRETLSYFILNQYMHSPRANYANVYVNNQLIGLYVNTESITKSFVKEHFGSNTNPFFKAAIMGGANLNSTNKPNLLFLGNNQGLYEARFEMKSETGWEDLINLTNILNNNTAQIETVLDVDRTLWMLAFNNVLVNLDSYTGLLNHNYYLYKDNSGRFSPIVWDLNMSFGTFDFLSSQNDFVFTTASKIAMNPYVQQNRTSWPLLNKLLANPRYKKMYVAHMQAILSENFSNDNYAANAAFLRSLIGSSVQNDLNKFYTQANYQNSLTTSMQVDEFVASGIVELMSGRKAFLSNLPDFTAAKPVVVEVLPSNLNPLINTNITFTAQITNANADGVFLGYRTDLSNRFTKIQMFDDGAHNDGAAGDNTYGTDAVLINNAYMQYYVFAENNSAGVFSPPRAEHEFFIVTATNNINPGEIAINEVMAQNTSTITDPAGQFEDWIELYNNTSSPLLLDGLFLSDTSTNLQKWQFPNGITIPAHGYLTVWADEDLTEDGLHADFKLSASGESVIFSKADGSIVDTMTFGAQTENIAFARNPNGTGSFVAQVPTFNANNEVLSVDEIDGLSNDFALYPNPASDYINILAVKTIDAIEIYNMVGQKVAIQSAASNQSVIDISHLPAGTYMVKLFTDDRTATSKFVKW